MNLTIEQKAERFDRIMERLLRQAENHTKMMELRAQDQAIEKELIALVFGQEEEETRQGPTPKAKRGSKKTKSKMANE